MPSGWAKGTRMRLKSFVSLFDWTFLLSMAGFLLWFRLGKSCFTGVAQELYVPFLAIGFCVWSIGWTLLASSHTERIVTSLGAVACVGGVIAVLSPSDAAELFAALASCLAMAGLMMLACHRVETIRSSRLCVSAMAALLLARVVTLGADRLGFDVLLFAIAPIGMLLTMGRETPAIVAGVAPPSGLSASPRFFASFVLGVLLYGAAMGVFKGGAEVMGRNFMMPFISIASTGVLLVVALAFFRSNPCLRVFRVNRAFVFIGLAAMLSFVWPFAPLGKSLVLSAQFCFLMLFFIVAPRIVVSVRGRQVELFGWGFALFFASSCMAEFAFDAFVVESLVVENAPAFLAMVLVFLVFVDLLVFKDDDFDLTSRRKDEGVHARDVTLRDIVGEIEGEFHLSPREAEVLLMWVNGETAGEIARRLFVSESTVRSHIKSLYAKCEVHSRQELRNFVNETLRDASISETI